MVSQHTITADKLHPLHWELIDYALMAKQANLDAGVYDDFPGECNRRNSETREWHDHLGSIRGKIAAQRTRELTSYDWVEIFYALDHYGRGTALPAEADEVLNLIGPDGKNIACEK